MNAAGQIELDTRQPVMAMGGFSGGYEAPTLAELQALVADGSLRFVAPEGAGPGGRSSGIAEWVQAACTPLIERLGIHGMSERSFSPVFSIPCFSPAFRRALYFL